MRGKTAFGKAWRAALAVATVVAGILVAGVAHADNIMGN